MTGRAPGLVALVLALALAGCGGAADAGGGALGPGPIAVPPRAATAGEPLLALLPAGADVIVEIDLARLRANPVVGEIAAAWLAGAEVAVPLSGDAVEPALLRVADAVVLAAYRVGTADAATLTLLAGAAVPGDAVPGARVIAAGVLAVGPAALLDDASAAAAGAREVEPALRALRATAMPAQAEGATLRVTARLGFDARIALASALGADVAPATLSVWGDVADDLAVIARVDGAGERGEVAALRAMIARTVEGVAALPAVRLLGLAPSLRAVRLSTDEDGVDVVGLIGPRRLARAARRARAALSLPAKES